MAIAGNLAAVRRSIAEAAARSGRSPESVTLVAVTKAVGIEAALEAVKAGAMDLGESRVQEARRKHDAIGAGAVWHMIGPLQTNKVKYCPGLFSLIHSLDRIELIVELSRRFQSAGVVAEGLLEINVSGEPGKSGCAPERAVEILKTAAGLGGVRIRGVMTVPPYSEDPENSRQYFRRLREMSKELASLGLDHVSMDIISAGMSNDFAVAIEEGSTMVRVGTAIFGERSR
ncbi:MAG: YggS family pyridoxal phosphate-dependent enzyme [Nitrospinae bacterium]|nr:YggS family pyridoxal phosphate-dependent enzyme [Nitrospinota bacterium]